MAVSAAAKQTNPSRLGEGDKAPAFNLPTDNNGTASLDAYKGKHIVLYFYPKDATPGCTVEAHDFTKLLPEFAKADTVVLGVSKDDVKSHNKFKEKECITFPLIADTESTLCDAFNVIVDKNMYGKTYKGIERSTFLINKDGIIAKAWRKVSVDNHAQQVLEAAKAL